MARMWIVIGDMTSSGGRVISGSPFTDIDGKPVSRINDKATCPKHKGVFPIVDGDVTMIVDGQPVALHGSSLACGCKVLTAQQNHVFVDAGGGGGGGAAGTSAITQAATTAAAAIAASAQYDEAFVLKSEITGRPLANRQYQVIRGDGSIEAGTTDDGGATHLTQSDKPETLVVEIGEEEVA